MNVRTLTAAKLRFACLLAALSACEAEDAEPARDSATGEENASTGDAGGWQHPSDGAASTDDASSTGTSGSARDAASSSEDAGRGDRDAGTGNDSGAPSRDAGQSTGRTCGGIAALKCAAQQFCNYEAPAGQGCSGQIADAAGVCEATPEVCTDQYQPVCGCDKRTYSNRCEAHAAGVSVAKDGACAVTGTSCDRRKLTCRRAEPVCPEGQVAEMVGNCFGECVGIEECACSEAAACPQEEKYTCHRSAMHCGPYVN